nr:sugar porter family MFS transporter [Vibrio agarilyticus]
MYAFIVALGGFVFGLDAAVISGTVRYISAEFMLTDLQVGTVVSAPSLGAIIALCFAGKAADKYGRKNTLVTIALLYVISAIGSALATSYEMLVAFRFIGGLAFSSLSLASMYIGEIAPNRLRGKLVTVNQLNIVIGLSAAYFINFYLVEKADASIYLLSNEGIWRAMLGSEIIPALIWFALVCMIPESPRWLIKVGHDNQAIQVLNKINSEEDAEAEFTAIKQNLVHVADISFKQQLMLLLNTKYRHAMFVGITIAVIQGVTGMNAILFYAPTVFEQVGFGVNAAFQQALYIGLTSFVFTVMAVLFIDRLGRRPLMLIGLTLAVLSHMTCWYGFYNAEYRLESHHVTQMSESFDAGPLVSIQDNTYQSDTEFKLALSEVLHADILKWHQAEIIEKSISINPALILIGILGFIAAFHISIGPIMWVLFSEIFPNSVRSVAIPVAAMVTSIASYLIQQFFPWQLANLGAANTFLVYGVFAAIGLLVMAMSLPETKGKTIEHIEILMGSNKKEAEKKSVITSSQA